MSNNLNSLNWASVAVDGFPVSMTEKFQGFVGLEECTDYSLDKQNKRSKKKDNKRKGQEIENTEPPNKRKKLSNGFVVEVCNTVKPSLTTEVADKKKKKKRKKKSKSKDSKTVQESNVETSTENLNTKPLSVTNNDKETNGKNKKTKNKKKKGGVAENDSKKAEGKQSKPKLGVLPQTTSDLTPEDMLTWAEFKLPEPIMKALTELGYKQPTKIQQLSLPAAIHGRRDILGAAETGSGKTLAFGLPILTGILKLKEKAEAKGLDVYEIPYKKTSHKKQNVNEKTDTKAQESKKKNNLKKMKSKNVENLPKESSEDGYSSGESDEESNGEQKSDEVFIEEIEVPLRKKDTSADEGNDSDDDDNYVHLSDMLDSDDLAENSDDDKSDGDDSDENDDEVKVDDNDVGNDDNDVGSDDNDVEGDESGDSGEEVVEDEDVDEDQMGIGCVKVVDNIEIPGHVVTRTGKPLYALILTPTRELAIQISRHLTAAAKYAGIRVATIVGGMAAVKQERVLRCGPEIVVATPGRLWELVSQGHAHLQQLDTVKFLAIDETDRMIERGHFEELYPLLERLNVDDSSRNARQNFVFSATLTMVHDLPSHLKGKKVTKRGKIINRKVEKMTAQQKIGKLIKMIGMTDPKVVDITAENLGTAATLTESRIACAFEHKDAYLYYILKRHPGRTIVFCNSIGSVKRLAQLLTILKCHPLPLHASMPQRQRIKNLERFQSDPHGVLIATDVAARGLDIPLVDHVIHYQVPRTAENYVHRSGRTARAHAEGLAVLMMEPTEAYLYAKLCRTLNKTTDVPTFPVEPQILSSLKDLVAIARDLDALELKKRRTAQALGWREKAAKEMDIIIDEDDIPTKSIDPTIDKALQAKRRQLNTMLSRPIYPRGFSFKYPTLNDQGALKISEENALQVMKKSIESGQLKKDKRKGKNATLLQLEKALKK